MKLINNSIEKKDLKMDDFCNKKLSKKIKIGLLIPFIKSDNVKFLKEFDAKYPLSKLNFKEKILLRDLIYKYDALKCFKFINKSNSMNIRFQELVECESKKILEDIFDSISLEINGLPPISDEYFEYIFEFIKRKKLVNIDYYDEFYIKNSQLTTKQINKLYKNKLVLQDISFLNNLPYRKDVYEKFYKHPDFDITYIEKGYSLSSYWNKRKLKPKLLKDTKLIKMFGIDNLTKCLT